MATRATESPARRRLSSLFSITMHVPLKTALTYMLPESEDWNLVDISTPIHIDEAFGFMIPNPDTLCATSTRELRAYAADALHTLAIAVDDLTRSCNEVRLTCLTPSTQDYAHSSTAFVGCPAFCRSLACKQCRVLTARLDDLRHTVAAFHNAFLLFTNWCVTHTFVAQGDITHHQSANRDAVATRCTLLSFEHHDRMGPDSVEQDDLHRRKLLETVVFNEGEFRENLRSCNENHGPQDIDCCKLCEPAQFAIDHSYSEFWCSFQDVIAYVGCQPELCRSMPVSKVFRRRRHPTLRAESDGGCVCPSGCTLIADWDNSFTSEAWTCHLLHLCAVCKTSVYPGEASMVCFRCEFIVCDPCYRTACGATPASPSASSSASSVPDSSPATSLSQTSTDSDVAGAPFCERREWQDGPCEGAKSAARTNGMPAISAAGRGCVCGWGNVRERAKDNQCVVLTAPAYTPVLSLNPSAKLARVRAAEQCCPSGHPCDIFFPWQAIKGKCDGCMAVFSAPKGTPVMLWTCTEGCSFTLCQLCKSQPSRVSTWLPRFSSLSPKCIEVEARWLALGSLPVNAGDGIFAGIVDRFFYPPRQMILPPATARLHGDFWRRQGWQSVLLATEHSMIWPSADDQLMEWARNRCAEARAAIHA